MICTASVAVNCVTMDANTDTQTYNTIFTIHVNESLTYRRRETLTITLQQEQHSNPINIYCFFAYLLSSLIYIKLKSHVYISSSG